MDTCLCGPTFFFKYNRFGTHALIVVFVLYRTMKPQPQPQPQADPRDCVIGSGKTASAELVFPRGPKPKHRCDDERHDNLPVVVSEMGFTFLFHIKILEIRT